ncbi:MAG: MFS transporter, partial [Spirochaetaceae bacterium]|nr:MFS transporter [Spirochaetaceae bacterium]
MSNNSAALPKRDKFSFSFALMGQTMIFNVVNLYLMIFYTDIFGLSAALVGTIFLVARFWDAVNDPIMGVLVDKTSTKWGKCRPYLLWFPAPIALITFLLFLSPNLGSTGKIIYATITYILWGMFYTAVDIPLWTMSSRMTVDSSQRQSTIAWGRVFNILGSFFPVILFVPLKNAFGGANEAKGYAAATLLFCIVALPLMIQSFWGTRERAPMTEEKKPTLKENLRAITHNKPLMLLLISTVLA